MRTSRRRVIRTAQIPNRDWGLHVWDAVLSFLSPSAHEVLGEPLGGGLAWPTWLRPQVFSTSRRLAPSETRSGLFHPDNALGVSTLQRLSLAGSRSPLGSRPLLMSGRSHHLQGFDPPANPCSHQAPVKAPDGRSSPELHPLQGLLPTCDGARVERVLPSCGCRAIRLRTGVSCSPLQGVDRQVDRLASFECCRPS